MTAVAATSKRCETRPAPLVIAAPGELVGAVEWLRGPPDSPHATRQHLFRGLARPDAVDLDEPAHRREGLDGLVVVQAIATGGPRRGNHAVATLPRPEGGDRQPAAERCLLD